jgi:RNA ligase (TIGR02306 family)
MSEFHVNVVRLTNVQKHPNADSLYIAKIHGGYPVIFKGKEFGGTFQEGDLAVYIPVDSVVPATKEWAWLSPQVERLLPSGEKVMIDPEVPRDKDRRVKAKKLRGVFSMGMLAPVPNGAVLGQDVAELMGVTKYVEPEEEMSASRTDGFQVKAPRLNIMPNVYDIEGMRRYPNAFYLGERYVATEKIHGMNARFVHDGEKLHIGSRTRWLTTEQRHTWSDVAVRYELENKLAHFPQIVFFGEIFGNNSDMSYGVDRNKTGYDLLFFDAWDSTIGRFLDYEELTAICKQLDLGMVPELAQGTWSNGEYERLLALAEGKTMLAGDHVREGFVIKPLKERFSEIINSRLILKIHGTGFLLRKEK